MKKSFAIALAMMILVFSCRESHEDSGAALVEPVASVIPANEVLKITWDDLTAVTFEEKYYEKEEAWMLFPTFGEGVKKLEGKVVEIKGYVIPLEPERYVLSANPFSSCFFCGNAGPETVMELDMTSYDKVFYTDDFLTFQGTFTLNDQNIDRMNYILTEASPIDGE